MLEDLITVQNEELEGLRLRALVEREEIEGAAIKIENGLGGSVIV